MLRTITILNRLSAGAAYTHELSHDAAMGLTFATTASTVLTGAVQAGSMMSAAAKSIPVAGLVMGVAGELVGLAAIAASYFKDINVSDVFAPTPEQLRARIAKEAVFLKKNITRDSVDLGEEKLDEVGQVTEFWRNAIKQNLKRENLRAYGLSCVAISLPVTALSAMSVFSSSIPDLLTGISLPFLGMAITSGMQFIKELNALAENPRPSGIEILSPMFKAIEMIGWGMLACGNPVIGLPLLGAALIGQYEKCKLGDPTFAVLSTVSNTLFCRPTKRLESLADESLQEAKFTKRALV